jgi:tetratricopeptide (TPR) repeat protein
MKHPTSRLAKMFDSKNPLSSTVKPDKNGEYFFDRNGRIFEVILDYYRSGTLYIPPDIAEDIVKKEFKFFELEYPGKIAREEECSSNNKNIGEDKKEEEDDEEKYLKMSIDQRYNFAVQLVHTLEQERIVKGLNYLLEIYEEMEMTHKANESRLNESQLKQLLRLKKDCLYYIAFAHYRRGDNLTARKYIQKLFEIEPNSKKGKALYTLINDSGSGYAKLGLLFVAVLSVTCYIGWRTWQSRTNSRLSL